MFRGAYTALVTPFRDGNVDDAALVRLVEAQIAGGIHGLVPCGTTGESPCLSFTEHIHVIEVVMRAVAGRVPVLAGAGSNSTQEAIELSRACKELGVAGTLQVTPYYNKPTQEGLFAHFSQIADGVGLPIVLYNVPGRTGVDLLPETVGKLSQHPLVVGVKEASADMIRAARVRELCGPEFDLLSGDDFTVLPLMVLGGDGVISVGTNVVPELFVQLVEAAKDNRWDRARELHYQLLPLSRALFSTTSPIPVKHALAMLGRMDVEMRAPLVPLDADRVELATLRRELENIGLGDELREAKETAR
ncbi:MAG: 4-hydroxy-tetrahydrodipicolinate synthase [Deltaproteobacteria bacterium]|nr:4-hydroxy-tetrahydrodipicolinate synthase [Nannocystaceae bacterium]